MTNKQIERFHSRYIKSDTGCWEWIGAKDKDGYGLFHAHPYQRAHRFSYVLFYNQSLKDLCVCHYCDNPSCVNPEHLWLGTIGDNNRDAMRKGRKIQPNKDKKVCKRGHEFTDENTYIQKSKNSRICKACRRVKIREWKKKQCLIKNCNTK